MKRKPGMNRAFLIGITKINFIKIWFYRNSAFWNNCILLSGKGRVYPYKTANSFRYGKSAYFINIQGKFL